LAELARANKADVDKAVAGAEAALAAWDRVDVHERAKVLWRIGDGILARKEELAHIEAVDCGKPITNASMIDIPRAAETFHYFAGWADKLQGETIPVRGAFLNYTIREPLGVIAAIIPWNFPFLLAARKIAPALACGNAVILKPAEQASLSSLLLGEIAKEAGLPDGLLQILTGLGEEVGAALVEHPGIAKVAFTGGTETGKRIMRASAGTLKKLSLELGGKSPNLVFADADPVEAGKAAARAVFYNSGEICTAGSRLLVERSVLEPVVESVVGAAKAFKVGPPLEAATQLGPLISAEHHKLVAGFISGAEAEGAVRRTGGLKEGSGFYIEPTVFTNVSEQSRLAREEVFGPVLAVIPFDSVEEAARIANASEFGLAAGVWTSDIKRAHRLARLLKAGTVWINCYNLFDVGSPYGGYKQSGFGRENGQEVLDSYTQTKAVWVAL
jgi:aldehyde dehydrogenase (NAD+)/phenylacetaldehyde dehydrogenase